MHALLICPDESLAARFELSLGRLGYSTAVEADPGRAHDALLARPARVVMIDWDALGEQALDLTEPLRSAPGRPVVVALTRKPIERGPELLASRVAFLDPEERDSVLELRLSLIEAFAARREEEDLRFLIEASAVLSATLDYDATLHNIAHLGVVSLADFCLVDVQENGGLKRIAALHRDPAWEPVMAVLRRAGPSSRGAIAEALRTQRPVLSMDSAPGHVRLHARDEEHLEAIHKLAPQSWIAVPMIAHGRIEGILSLGSQRPARYGEADRNLANELAARAALAIANARLHREEQLSAAKLQTLADATFEAIVVHEGSTVLLVNQAMAEMLGRPISELPGQFIYQYLAPESRDAVRDMVERGVTRPYEALALHADGRVFPIEVRARETVFEGRHVRVAAIRNLADRQKMQAQVMLADRLSAMGTLAAGVAHEINNPLSFVSLSIDFAQSRLGAGADPEVRSALGDAAAGAERVRRIVRDLRTLSRVEEDRQGPVDVGRVLEASLGIAGNELRHRAQVRTSLLPVPAVAASEWRLGQVFLNLLVNAAQAIPEGSALANEVSVATSVRDGEVCVEIADTGSGIPPEIRARIFDPFFTTKPAGVGTGLGLAICQNIVAELGGRIEVESAPGKGTAFRVFLPIARGEPRPAAVTPHEGPAPRRTRVLIVDDEPLLRLSLVRLLAGTHDARAVGSAQEVLDLVRAGQTFEVLLCDVMMPGMSGAELHGLLAQEAPALAAHTIFLTGGAFSGKAAQFLETVPNPRLEKPFEPHALLDAIAAMAP